jgi:hypothetical protein
VLSVLETCRLRPEIEAGTFNPEVFTAALGPVIEFYRTGRSVIDKIYTDAHLFFREATYPTQGLRLTLGEVFARIAGDMLVPAIHRLETAFGGGKTHTLIACTHIAFRGTELQDVTADLIDPKLLPAPGSVAVVGVAGEEIPVHKPKGDVLVPYTLWGEIAYQIGGESLYRQVEDEATSYAAPGKTYFDTVFGGRKVLIMLDELAQYAARLEAARPDGANQLAAFLMALHGYARSHPGIAIVLTLASATDAFAKQTQRLAELLSQVRGDEVGEDDALALGERAVQGVTSVVARDAVQVIPVQAAEISSVLAKRLFLAIDRQAARETAAEYMEMYRRNTALLPEEACREDFKERMVATYPFHPTLLDFLNEKLAEAETFQGTRGVLRVLAAAVQSLWQKRQAVPMIHTCHLDLRSERVVNEIFGRTGSSDLLPILNADVGSVDTGKLEGGQSNAELADRHNPHPQGHPYHEYTWRTVFLHSLVGREEGLDSKIFGLTEPEALFAVSFPGLTPPQVRIALERINDEAFYLRCEKGRYFASPEPTLNNVLARIRKTVTERQIKELLEEMARKIIQGRVDLFHVEHDVTLPEHLPDGLGKPALGIVPPTAEAIDVEAVVTTKGSNKPRLEQNLVFLLVPETVRVQNFEQQEVISTSTVQTQDLRRRIEDLARQVEAIRLLTENPRKYGVNPARLSEDEFRERYGSRGNDLETAVAGLYNSLYYPAGGQIVRREIKSGSGESGVAFIEQIRQILLQDGELITSGSTTKADLTNLSKLFFEQGDVISLEKLQENFCRIRSWPILENPTVLEQIVRAGVQQGFWCVFRMDDPLSARPTEFYHQGHEIPLGADLTQKGYSLVTAQGAKQRGWLETRKIDPRELEEGVIYAVASEDAATVEKVAERVAEKYGDVPAEDVEEAIATLVRTGRVYLYQGMPDEKEKPNLIYGARATLYTLQPGDVLITPAQAAARGWTNSEARRLILTGQEGAKKFLPLLRRLGSIYNRGARSAIEALDLANLELPAGGTLRLQLSNVTPESMKALGELFEVLNGVAKEGDDTEVFLEIADPDESCPLIQELKKE